LIGKYIIKYFPLHGIVFFSIIVSLLHYQIFPILNKHESVSPSFIWPFLNFITKLSSIKQSHMSMPYKFSTVFMLEVDCLTQPLLLSRLRICFVNI